jgi:hypothetical protein
MRIGRPQQRVRFSAWVLALVLTMAALLPASAFALITLGGSSLVSAEVPLLGKVEVSLPKKVEVPPLVTVEVPTLPKVEVPSAETPSGSKGETQAPVEAPSAPTTTPPSTPSSPAGSPPAAATGTTAQAASSSSGSATAPSGAHLGTGATVTRGSTHRAQRGSGGSSTRKHRAGRSSPATSHPTVALGSVASSRGGGKQATTPNHSKKTGGASSSNPLDAIGRNIPLPLPVPDWSKPIILLLALAAIGFALRSRRAGIRARRLEAQRAGLLEDVDAMQATLVPPIPGRVGALRVSVAYRPADGPAAGGDFYDIIELEHGNVAIILGDVAGHGREALERAALMRYTLRAYIQTGLEPRAALALAGSVLADASAARFATIVVGLYYSSSATLKYASAAHPAPIALGFRQPEPLTVCCSPPVGWDVPTGRRQTTIPLTPGTGMCFFSDGLIEARTAHGLLGREGLAEIIAELETPADAAALLERVRAGALATPDDMVSCIIAPAAAVARVGRRAHIEELEVDVESVDETRIGPFLLACGVPEGRITTAVTGAQRLAEESGTALLRVERLPGRAAAVTVHRGLSVAQGAPPSQPALL